MDIKSPEARSRNMSRIRNADTKPERYVRSLLHRSGYRYRLHAPDIPGKPDLYFPGKKTAVFVHGCYWHRHPGCPYAYTPKSNVEFWVPKLEGNRKRDEVVRCELLSREIRVLILWECTVKRMRKEEAFRDGQLARVRAFLDHTQPDFLEL